MGDGAEPTAVYRAFAFLRRYPIPPVALAGLVAGSAATWGLGNPALGNLIWTAGLILGGVPLVVRTSMGLLRGKLAADVIAMLAILAAIYFGEGFAGCIIVLMQSGGETLEDYGLGRASSALTELAARAPRTANREEGGKVTVVEAAAVRPGDVLLVKKGEMIPVDGTMLSDTAEVDESAVTGEPLPGARRSGDQLLSGSVNAGDSFRMKASRISSESEYSKIVETVRRAEEGKPRFQRLADRYAVWFTPLTVAVALLGALVTADPRTFLSVLVVATPCPLILATPIAVISGVNRAASEGIVVKSGAALEQVAEAKVVAFDKTGTLTYGAPSIESVMPLEGWTEDELLLLAASVEQLSSHPIANSVTEAGKSHFGALPSPGRVEEATSRGVEGTVNGRVVAVGRRSYCEEKAEAPFPAEFLARAGDLTTKGKLVTYVAVDGRPAGVVVFVDRVRPGVSKMVESLRELGIGDVVMLTGDNEENARVIARQSGISSYKAGLLPQQKVDEISRLKASLGPTVMVGDGINDAPALAVASIGVAMGAKGTAISAEAADIVLLVDDVTKVPAVIEGGRKMKSVARQGINFGLGASLVLMALAALGFIQPAPGATLQEVIDVSVILNALRVR